MDSTTKKAVFVTQSPYMAQLFQEGWHDSAAQLHDMDMVDAHSGQMPDQMCSSELVQSVPCWFPVPGEASQQFHSGQSMVYQTGYPYNGYQEMSYQAADPVGFHCPHGVSMVPSFEEVPTHTMCPQFGDQDHLAMLPTPDPHVQRYHYLQECPAVYPTEVHHMYAPAPSHLTDPGLQDLGDGSGLQDLPEVMSLEDSFRFFQCEPEPIIADMSQTHAKPELGDPAVTGDHCLDHADGQACVQRHLEAAECSDRPFSVLEAAPTMDFFYNVEDVGLLPSGTPSLTY